MTNTRQPTSEYELRRELRGRHVYVAVPIGSTTELLPTTANEAVRLWNLAGDADGPRRVHLDNDDLELIDLAVLHFNEAGAGQADEVVAL